MRHLIVQVFGNLAAVEVGGHSAQVAKPDRCFQSGEGFAHLREALQVEDGATSEATDSRWDVKARQVRLTLWEPPTRSFRRPEPTI